MMACGRSTTTWRWRGHWEAWKISRRCSTATSVHERGNSRRARDERRVVNQSTSSVLFHTLQERVPLLAACPNFFLSRRRALIFPLLVACFPNGAVPSNGSCSVLGGESPYILSNERDMHIGTHSVLAMLDDYYTDS
jgi:hypothetical protein